MNLLGEKIQQKAIYYLQKMREIRREIHKFPELSGSEKETAKRICHQLDLLNIPYQKDIAGYGIVALIQGEGIGKKNTIALRADMDALPILEQNTFDYKSVNKGVMHACGHDFHIASLLGTLMILNDLKTEWSGIVKAIFQPSEEEYEGGAPFMINAGVLENPQPQIILGLHADPDLKIGQIGWHQGEFMASTDEIHIEIIGKGGHAARPFETINPLYIGAKILLRLEEEITIPNAHKAPFVLNFGHFHANGSTNIIPDKAVLLGTLRMFNEKLRPQIHQQIHQIAKDEAAKHDATCNINIRLGYPMLYNDPAITHQAVQAAQIFLGPKNTIKVPQRCTAEDFSYYLQHIPGCFLRIGVHNEAHGTTPKLHSAHFDADDEALPTAAGFMAFFVYYYNKLSN